MEKIISDSNSAFVKQTIDYLSNILGISDPKKVLWLVFGSYVINMNKEGSDLDIIGIDDNFIEDKRQSFTFNDIPIHFTTINKNTIKDDGEKRLYGAYFSGKIINPHIFFYGNDESKREAIYHSGKFIAPLAGYLGTLTNSTSFTASQVTALVFIAYLSTDPSFDSYFLNYFSSPEFWSIWESLCKSTIHMLVTAKEIIPIGKKYMFVDKFSDYKQFHSERMKIAARHWSYGAVCHKSNYKFQDEIFSKAEEKMKKTDPSGTIYQEMITFLKQESKLKEIYI